MGRAERNPSDIKFIINPLIGFADILPILLNNLDELNLMAVKVINPLIGFADALPILLKNLT
jgi:hypothetical protein